MGLLDYITEAVDARKRYYANLGRGLLSMPQETLDQLRAQNAENVWEQARAAQETQSVMPEVAEPARRAAFDQAMNAGLLGITVYHGSPHKFDKFDASKIGTGEGAQAYGHGLYFAENPDVAKSYARNLAETRSPQMSVNDLVHQMSRNSPSSNTLDAVRWYMKQDPVLRDHVSNDSLIADIHKAVIGRSADGTVSAGSLGAYDRIDKYFGKTRPHTYKVDIPDEAVAKMLDWDKPLSQQPEAVRKALEPIIAPLRKEAAKNVGGWGDLGKAYNIDNELTGQQIVGLMRTKIPSVSNIIGGGGPVVTNKLRELGIPGIRYLDGGSRGKGNGTSNFVLFDDQLPKIIGRE